LLGEFLGSTTNELVRLLWPRDPAQTPNLLCDLEARLADGHSSTVQTKTLQHCDQVTNWWRLTARILLFDPISCRCCCLVVVSAVSWSRQVAWLCLRPSKVVLKRVCCADCAELGIARSFPLLAVWAIQRCFYSKNMAFVRPTSGIKALAGVLLWGRSGGDATPW
jgi:hypothetical protein